MICSEWQESDFCWHCFDGSCRITSSGRCQLLALLALCIITPEWSWPLRLRDHCDPELQETKCGSSASGYNGESILENRSEEQQPEEHEWKKRKMLRRAWLNRNKDWRTWQKKEEAWRTWLSNNKGWRLNNDRLLKNYFWRTWLNISKVRRTWLGSMTYAT